MSNNFSAFSAEAEAEAKARQPTSIGRCFLFLVCSLSVQPKNDSTDEHFNFSQLRSVFDTMSQGKDSASVVIQTEV
jgi:hypothetical protein